MLVMAVAGGLAAETVPLQSTPLTPSGEIGIGVHAVVEGRQIGSICRKLL